MPVTDERSVPNVRRQAVRKLIISTALAVPAVAALVWLMTTGGGFSELPKSVRYGAMFFMGSLLVPTLAALTEVIAGHPFLYLARRWDSLKGYQRGVLGLAIVAMALAIFGVIGGSIAMALTSP